MCPTCGREWCNEEKGYHCLRAAIASRDAEVADLRARLEAAVSARDRYRDDAIIERRIADNLNADVKELKAALSRYRIDGDSPVDVRALEANLAAALSDVARLTRERDEAISAVAEARGLVAEARNALAGLRRERDEARGKALEEAAVYMIAHGGYVYGADPVLRVKNHGEMADAVRALAAKGGA